MRKIKYPLIVSDFDGTLVKNDGTISEFTKKVLTEYIENGGKFAISTGRMPEGIISRAKELGLKGVVCCGQGTALVDIQTREVLSTGVIQNEIAVKICEKMESMGLHIHVYDLWTYYSNMDDAPLKLYESIVKCKAQVVDKQPISAFVKQTGLAPFKLLAMVEEKDAVRVMEELASENFQDCVVTRSSPFLIEVNTSKFSKGTAVAFLAKIYGVDLKDTLAIGDQQNDITMLETAGRGFAVQNADEIVKAHAEVFPFTNDEDAVAKIIERYAYEG